LEIGAPARLKDSLLLLLRFLAALAVGCGQLAAASFTQPDAKALPNLFIWTDTCNVHVLRDGEAALLINLGDGSVLEHLADIGDGVRKGELFDAILEIAPAKP
jgi:hypothetical protein